MNSAAGRRRQSGHRPRRRGGGCRRRSATAGAARELRLHGRARARQAGHCRGARRLVRFQQCCTELAQRHGLWIVAGTIALRDPAEAQRIIAASLVYDAGGPGARPVTTRRTSSTSNCPRAVIASPQPSRPRAATRVCSAMDRRRARGGLSGCATTCVFPELYRRHAQEGALLADGAFGLHPCHRPGRTGRRC